MDWLMLEEVSQLEMIQELSYEAAVVIFKHSTRCSISAMAKDRLERSWNAEQHKDAVVYYLDLIRFRDVSDKIASKWSIAHQSPQTIIIKDGECVYHASHMGINYQDIKNVLQN